MPELTVPARYTHLILYTHHDQLTTLGIHRTTHHALPPHTYHSTYNFLLTMHLPLTTYHPTSHILLATSHPTYNLLYLPSQSPLTAPLTTRLPFHLPHTTFHLLPTAPLTTYHPTYHHNSQPWNTPLALCVLACLGVCRCVWLGVCRCV